MKSKTIKELEVFDFNNEDEVMRYSSLFVKLEDVETNCISKKDIEDKIDELRGPCRRGRKRVKEKWGNNKPYAKKDFECSWDELHPTKQDKNRTIMMICDYSHYCDIKPLYRQLQSLLGDEK